MASRFTKELNKVYPHRMAVETHTPMEIQEWLVEKLNSQPKGKFGRWYSVTVPRDYSKVLSDMARYQYAPSHTWTFRVYFKSINDYLMFKLRWA